MELCCSNHEEICYDQGTCPLCAVLEEIDTLKIDIETLEEKITSLEEEE